VASTDTISSTVLYLHKKRDKSFWVSCTAQMEDGKNWKCMKKFLVDIKHESILIKTKKKIIFSLNMQKASMIKAYTCTINI